MINYPALHPGKAGFANIRRRGGLYVDKTPFLRRLLGTDPVTGGSHLPPMPSDSHLFLARPRRFGKSLLVDTLETWFQGLSPHRTAELGDGEPDTMDVPVGWSSPAWLWDGLDAEDWHGHHGWHPVIRLDMSRVIGNSSAEIGSALQHYLIHVVKLWEDRGLTWTSSAWERPQADDLPSNILSELTRVLGRVYGSRPVVLVDEYDAPVTRLIGTERHPEVAVHVLRDFYRVLKDDDDLLYCVFLTGITRFARSHLFSAANNITDVSDWEPYAAVCGFTEAEVVRDLEPHRQALMAQEPGFRDENMLAEWRDFYDGYRFAPHPGTERVYNPFTLLHGLQRTLKEPNLRALAADGHWPSAWSESGHPGLTARLAADAQQDRPGTVWEGGRPPLPAPGLVDLARPDYSRLMLDTGYYTWHGVEANKETHLNFPNKEVAASWVRDILHLWTHPLHQGENIAAHLHACLARGDVPGFAQRLETFAFGMAGENLQSEASFRTLLQALFLQMGVPTQSEKSTPGGRADHEITLSNHVYVIEAKYNRPAHEGLSQIRQRPYGREHLGTDRTVTAVALAFRRDGKQGARLECEYADLPTLLRERELATDTAGAYKPPMP